LPITRSAKFLKIHQPTSMVLAAMFFIKALYHQTFMAGSSPMAKP